MPLTENNYKNDKFNLRRPNKKTKEKKKENESFLTVIPILFTLFLLAQVKTNKAKI